MTAFIVKDKHLEGLLSVVPCSFLLRHPIDLQYSKCEIYHTGISIHLLIEIGGITFSFDLINELRITITNVSIIYISRTNYSSQEADDLSHEYYSVSCDRIY